MGMEYCRGPRLLAATGLYGVKDQKRSAAKTRCSTRVFAAHGRLKDNDCRWMQADAISKNT